MTAQPHVNVRLWRHELATRRVQLWDVGHNLVPTSGLTLLATRLMSTSVPPLSHLAVGIGAAPPAPTDIALGNEVFRDVFTQVTMLTGGVVIRNYLGPNAANGSLLTEAGLFTGTILYARRLFDTPLDKTPDTAATLEWTLTFTADDAVTLTRSRAIFEVR